MPGKTVTCEECGWSGDQASLEKYQCPSCDSRQLRTESARLTQEGNRDPPEGADEGEDFSAAD